MGILILVETEVTEQSFCFRQPGYRYMTRLITQWNQRRNTVSPEDF